MPSLELINIVKKYGHHVVLKDLSFNISDGSIFGLLGPNGSGKTSLMRLMTRITLPDSGKILINGEPINRNHIKKVGYMPEERGLYKNMKVKDHLLYFSKLHNMGGIQATQKINEWLSVLNMKAFENKFVGELSKGMSQKVQFISTVLNEPDLLILDEPFSGLDPISSESLEVEIKKLSKNGVTIVLSTHRMEQIENFCNEVVLINNGTKILEGNVKHLKQQYKEGIVRVETDYPINEDILKKYNVVKQNTNELLLKFENYQEQKKFLMELYSANITLLAFNELLPSISSIFINQVNNHSYKAINSKAADDRMK